MPKAPALTHGASDVLKLAEAGVDKDVINSFIAGYDTPFNLKADDIAYLGSHGVSSDLIHSMLIHDASLAEQSKTDQELQAGAGPGSQPSPPVGTPTNDVEQFPPPTYIDNPPSEVATFYDTLAPYGSWLYLKDRGWCWQPSAAAVNSQWQPYVDGGRWCYTDDGWYWDSSYSWGWAPFHYGRWWNAPCGWVWFPDTVWAPSWVAWRYSDPYCGWAALPPSTFPVLGLGLGHFAFDFDFGLGFDSFFFVGFGDVLDHDLRFHRFQPHDRGFFDRTTLVRGSFRSSGNLVRNFGVPVDHIERVSGKPVPVISVSQRLVDPRNVRPGVVGNGDHETVFRPELPTPARNTSRMVGQELQGNQKPLRSAGSIREPSGASPGAALGNRPIQGEETPRQSPQRESQAPAFQAPATRPFEASPTPPAAPRPAPAPEIHSPPPEIHSAPPAPNYHPSAPSPGGRGKRDGG